MNKEHLPITNYKFSKEIKSNIITETPPEKLDENSVIYWSRHFKEIMGAPKGKARATKAKSFMKNKCIRYDKDMGVFYCDPIKDYNKSIYTIKNKKGGGFECNCQFYEKVCKDSDMICSHILAVFLWLKIKNWKGKNEI